MLRRAWIAAFLLVSVASAPALGQIDKKAADALFKEGRVAFDKGDFATACKKFEESQRADPAIGTLLNLAVCEERSGKLTSAKRHLAEVLAALPAKDERVGLAKDVSAKVEARLAWITLTLTPGAPADTTVKDAGGAAIALNAPVPLDPGEHTLVVGGGGQPETRLVLRLSEGQRETRAVGTAAAVAPAPVEPSRSGSGKMRRTIGFAVGGVGVAGFAVAAVTGVILLGKKSDMDAECPNQRCTKAGLALLEENKNTGLLPVNTIGWIFGITGVTAGAVLVLTSGIGERQTTTSIGPAMFGSGAGIGTSGTF